MVRPGSFRAVSLPGAKAFITIEISAASASRIVAVRRSVSRGLSWIPEINNGRILGGG